MMDGDLITQTDYTEGQREAARRVLVEVGNVLHDYWENILVVGGWVPELLFPAQDHIGSVDVDLLLNHQRLVEASYVTIEKILKDNGYKTHPEKYFSFVREIEIAGKIYRVDLDMLAGTYGGTSKEKRSQHIQGIKALKATGGNFAFETSAKIITLKAKRPDGADDTVHIRVVSIMAFLVMKAAALGRGKSKDAYDIYFCLKHWPGGVDELARLFEPVRKHGLVSGMCQKLREKFASPEHAGPKDVADFLDLSDDEEREQQKRDVFERISRLVDLIEK